MKQKNYQNLTKNTLGKLPVWNLKDLYESPKAKNLNNDLNQLRRITKKFEKKYTYKITKLCLYGISKIMQCIKVLLAKFLFSKSSSPVGQNTHLKLLSLVLVNS